MSIRNTIPFVLVTFFAVVASLAYANPRLDRWVYELGKDDFTDKEIHSSSVFSQNNTSTKFGFIGIVCRPPNQFEYKISVGTYIGDKRIRNNVKYRVDQQPMQEFTMKPTSERYVYENDIDSTFIDAISSGETQVLIQLTSYDFDSAKMSFPLKGSTKAIKQVRERCK